MKTIAEQLNVKSFPFIIKDSKGSVIYVEESNGFWKKMEYDSKGNQIYYETSKGYWEKREYDKNGNIIYYEDSNGFWSKSEFDSEGNRIYFEDSDGHIEDKRKFPEFTMKELVDKIGNFKLIK